MGELCINEIVTKISGRNKKAGETTVNGFLASFIHMVSMQLICDHLH